MLMRNTAPEGGNNRVQFSTSHIQLRSLNTVMPTAMLKALRGRGGLWSKKTTRYKGGDGTETMLLWVKTCMHGENNWPGHTVCYFKRIEKYKWSNEAGESND